MNSNTDTVGSISIDAFDYPLPPERIASYPLTERDQCLLLVRDNQGNISTRRFYELPSLLPEGAMLIYNNTKVINARLRFNKGELSTGAAIEIFCLEPEAPRDYASCFAVTGCCQWKCLVGNSKRWKNGLLTQHVTIDGCDVTLSANRMGRHDQTSTIEFTWHSSKPFTWSEIISVAGEIPIPPYLGRKTQASDNTDYQTVFSHIQGSVAAPTAGLHFTPKLLADLDAHGIERRELTLHVGAGTFQPVKSDTLSGHEMHSELIDVDRTLIADIAATDRTIVAVGTTSVRTLESLYHLGCMASQGQTPTSLPQWYPYCASHPDLDRADAMNALLRYLDQHHLDRLIASTRLMIAPGYDYRIVQGMVTNFHQPRSTLLLLVSAFTKGDWRKVYDYALSHRDFRFLSYGDACLFL